MSELSSVSGLAEGPSVTSRVATVVATALCRVPLRLLLLLSVGGLHPAWAIYETLQLAEAWEDDPQLRALVLPGLWGAALFSALLRLLLLSAALAVWRDRAPTRTHYAAAASAAGRSSEQAKVGRLYLPPQVRR